MEVLDLFADASRIAAVFEAWRKAHEPRLMGLKVWEPLQRGVRRQGEMPD
jgi:hypothetical protein